MSIFIAFPYYKCYLCKIKHGFYIYNVSIVKFSRKNSYMQIINLFFNFLHIP